VFFHGAKLGIKSKSPLYKKHKIIPDYFDFVELFSLFIFTFKLNIMNNIKVAIFLMVVTVFSAQICFAAFPEKSVPEKSTTAFSTVVKTGHGQMVYNLKKIWSRGKAKIEKTIYIVMCVFLLGWLAMGLNDNFEGYDWAISLILYLLGWLPGLIYSLIKMSKYY
jgi:uncharacterized membrane protein YqaE (UPF0057 family)